MTEWTHEDFGPMPGPSVRREDGYRDAYARRIPRSSDKHYRVGYALGERLRPESTVQGPPAGPELADGPGKLRD